MEVASQVAVAGEPVHQMLDATLQSNETRPHGWEGTKKPGEEGWMTVLCVRFQLGSQRGAGQGRPLRAHVGDGGEKPPEVSLQ